MKFTRIVLLAVSATLVLASESVENSENRNGFDEIGNDQQSMASTDNTRQWKLKPVKKGHGSGNRHVTVHIVTKGRQHKPQKHKPSNEDESHHVDSHSHSEEYHEIIMPAESGHHHHHHKHTKEIVHHHKEEEQHHEVKEKIKVKHHHHHHHHNHVKTVIKKVPEPYPVDKVIHVPVEKLVHVPKPYPVEKVVEKIVHVPVEKIIHIPKPVPVEKIVEKIVHIPKPYPVEKIVEKPVHIEKKVRVEVKVPYPVEKIVHVPKPYPVEKIVEKIVHVPKPYPVYKHIHVPVEIKVPVPIEKPVPYPVEKKVPYPVKVPYEVEKKVPYPVKVEIEKKVPYPVRIYIPQPYPVEKKAPVPIEVKAKNFSHSFKSSSFDKNHHHHFNYDKDIDQSSFGSEHTVATHVNRQKSTPNEFHLHQLHQQKVQQFNAGAGEGQQFQHYSKQENFFEQPTANIRHIPLQDVQVSASNQNEQQVVLQTPNSSDMSNGQSFQINVQEPLQYAASENMNSFQLPIPIQFVQMDQISAYQHPQNGASLTVAV